MQELRSIRNIHFRALVLALLAWNSAFGSPVPRGWKIFESTTYGFKVRYPAQWQELRGIDGTPRSKDSLDIINFPNSERAQGVVIKKGGAEISVGPAGAGSASIDDWIRDDTKFDTQVERRTIKMSSTNPSGSMSLVEVTSLSEVGPDARISRTVYFCSTRRGAFAVLLTNWQGDPKEVQLRELAREIVLSLRIR